MSDVATFARQNQLVLRQAANADSARYWWTFDVPARGWPDPVKFADGLESDERVLWSQAVLALPVLKNSVNDTYYSLQYQLKSTQTLNGVAVDVNVEPAWAVSLGSGIRVAILNDGVLASHPDLGGRVTLGQDFKNCAGGANCASNPIANDVHGTLVAGLVAATSNNGVGVSGVAPAATLVPVRIFQGSINPIDPTTIAAAIGWAWRYGAADVISNSWSYPQGAPLDQIVAMAIDSARTLGRGGRGSVVVFSTGDDIGQPIPAPASYGGVIAVNAMTPSGMVPFYANTGPQVAIAVPSTAGIPSCANANDGVISTTLILGDPCSGNPSQGYSYLMGATSAAAPVVAGGAALLLAKWPQLSALDVRGRMMSTADQWLPVSSFGSGKLNLGRALTATWPAPILSIAGPASMKPSASCTWSATIAGGVQPFQITWKVDGSVYGNDSLLEVIRPSVGTHSILLTVVDAMGSTATKATSFLATTSAPTCL